MACINSWSDLRHFSLAPPDVLIIIMLLNVRYVNVVAIGKND